MNSDFFTKMKYHVKITLDTLDEEGILDFQTRWEFLKFLLISAPCLCLDPSLIFSPTKSHIEKLVIPESI